ncbi:MAG: phosphate ABC transporter permease subunit PstC [Chloroflexi bacterium]|nr:MAG: phosphate ABC transporter permease subunit PstC [Chloroflexota bacterium]
MAAVGNEGVAKQLTNKVRVGDWAFVATVTAAATITLLVTIGLFWELGVNAYPAFAHNGGLAFIWNLTWDPPREVFGAGTFIVGTLITSIASLIVATIVAVLVAVYLVEIAPPYIARPISTAVELLAAVPSVVYGLWGVFVLGIFIRDTGGPAIVKTLGWIPLFNGVPLITGMFSAVLILSVMILPTIMAVSRDVIAAVPRNQREGILAMGATRWEMIQLTVLPYARSGVLGASILGLARAVGETLAVTLVIGNRVAIPTNIFAPGYTMASAIANQFTEVENNMHRASLLEVALVLLVITFIINAVARFLVWRVTGGVRVAVQE